MSELFPMFVKLEDRSVLVVGAGAVGQSKIEGLLRTGADVRVVSLTSTIAVQEWARNGLIDLREREFQPGDLDDVLLAVIATSSAQLNRLIFKLSRERGILCNVVDVPDLCHFYYPAVVRRGDLQIAVSTAGQSPFLAQKIREQLEKQYGPHYAEWVQELGETRSQVLKSDLPSEQKRDLLHSLASREAFEAAVQRHSNGKQEGHAA